MLHVRAHAITNQFSVRCALTRLVIVSSICTHQVMRKSGRVAQATLNLLWHQMVEPIGSHRQRHPVDGDILWSA